jgi:DNA sulfur modification protein DndD
LGYNDDKIRKWYEELEENQKNLSSEIQKLAEREHSKKDKEKIQKELKEKLDKEISKQDKLKIIERKISFCSKAISIVSNTKVNIMNSTKEKINDKTNEYFFELVWKDSSFAKINFDEEYNMKLIHNIGYDCLGTIGAAERELLALSFTLALHSVSGFNAPIIVDTPVARVDNENRENFGNVFVNITGSEKQAIILFTPSEYSDSISKIIDLHANKRFNIVMSSDENESQLEEL